MDGYINLKSKEFRILQIRNAYTMEAIKIEIKVEDIEKFKSFMRKQELRYTFEEVDNEIDLD